MKFACIVYTTDERLTGVELGRLMESGPIIGRERIIGRDDRPLLFTSKQKLEWTFDFPYFPPRRVEREREKNV